jgi:nucleoside-diphosphate-sugar epimerase
VVPIEAHERSWTDGPGPRTEQELEDALSRPSAGAIETLARLEGDIVVLGAGGKMGLSLASMAVRALRAGDRATGGDTADAAVGGAAADEGGVAAGGAVAPEGSRRVIAVSRFHGGVQPFTDAGVETISLDLLDDGALESLPDAANVLFLAGMKFGSSGAQPMTWAMNTHLPGLVARRFAGSRIVALSTGNVYPFASITGRGSTEVDAPAPVGEYAITCLGRERMFSYYSERDATPTALIRLNYANALRYGVLMDIAQRVAAGEPVDVTMGAVNVIWQGDANAAILQSFVLCDSPPTILNVAGPEVLRVRWVAERLAQLLDAAPPRFVGSEADTALLSDSSRMVEQFGSPSVDVERLLAWTAEWLSSGGALLGKPTGFQVRDGRF